VPPSPGDYRWPGNIRQLHNVIETAVLLEPSNWSPQIKFRSTSYRKRLESPQTAKATSPFSWVRRSMRLNGNSSAAPSHSPTEITPEHRKFWVCLVGLYTGNSSATTLDTNPTAEPTGTDTARRAMIA
jgi:transcriptional regulator with AAA-type ATPase domain